MTNKPMLSVELRALLERVVAHDFAEYCQECGIGQSEMWKELRALLDNQVLESQYDGMTQAQAQVVSDGVDEILHGEPAAQHQGDPVAICRLWNEGGSGERTSVEFIGEPCADGTLLYAEQPAPVADHTQCEECKGWGYHENHHEGGGPVCGR